jgi:hypothetical protein
LKIPLLLVCFICSLLSIGVSEGFAVLEDEIMQSTAKVRENTRTMERIGEFLRECTSTLRAGDTSLNSTCDSLLQKQNIEMGKFFAENQVSIEELIYPYTIPSNAQTFLGLDSSTVTGSNDPTVAIEHGRTGVSFLELSSKISDECVSKLELNDMNGVKTCVSISDSLNSHLREFNQNTKPEFERVLGTAGP